MPASQQHTDGSAPAPPQSITTANGNGNGTNPAAVLTPLDAKTATAASSPHGLPPTARTALSFLLNGRAVRVADADPRTTLLEHLRSAAVGLTGAKLGCGEGGCGACTVLVTRQEGGKVRHRAVNACLAPLCSVDGCHVTTVEGVGSSAAPHPIQERMAKLHASQCGFCTPGIVMALYGKLAEAPRPSVAEIEEAFDGNLCRCTGYRPILDAAKTFAHDAPAVLGSAACQACPALPLCSAAAAKPEGESPAGLSMSMDLRLEDTREHVVTSSHTKVSAPRPEEAWAVPFEPEGAHAPPALPPDVAARALEPLAVTHVGADGGEYRWLRPATLAQLLAVARAHPDAKYVVGNTEVGIESKILGRKYATLVSTAAVPELNAVAHEPASADDASAAASLRVGAGVSLSALGEALEEAAGGHDAAKSAATVFASLRRMLKWFASTPVRNAASLGGNLCTASPIGDLLPMLIAAGAVFHLAKLDGGNGSGATESIKPRDVPAAEWVRGYRRTALEAGEVLVAVTICEVAQRAPLPSGVGGIGYGVAAAYKQCRRRDDDISIVTGAFTAVVAVGEDGKCTVAELRAAFGGIAPTTIAVPALGEALTGSAAPLPKADEARLAEAVAAAVALPPGVPGGMPAYRMSLVAGFAKRFLAECARTARAQAAAAVEAKADDAAQAATADEYDAADAADSYMTGGHPITRGVQSYVRDPNGGQMSEGHLVETESTAPLGDLPTSTRRARLAYGEPMQHRSGLMQTTGEAQYVDDMAPDARSLHAALVLSDRPVGKFTLTGLDSAASAPGVGCVVTARDLPGDRNLTGVVPPLDEHLFRIDSVTSAGQLLALVAAETPELAREAAARIKVVWEGDAKAPTAPQPPKAPAGTAISPRKSLAKSPPKGFPEKPPADVSKTGAEGEAAAAAAGASPTAAKPPLMAQQEEPVITIEQAIAAGSFHPPPREIRCGDAAAAIASADVTVEGEVRVAGQEHFYFETAGCIAFPRDVDEMEILASSQGLNHVQIIVARALHIPMHKVACRAKRLGGGFGGKETRGAWLCAAAAVAAQKARKPVRLMLDRYTDMLTQGTRHPFVGKYRMGATKDGKIVGYEVQLYSNGGYAKDLSLAVMDRALLHATNAYKFENVTAIGTVCKTNTANNTAFRGFGSPQAMLTCETAMEAMAARLGIGADTLRERHLIRDGEATHYGQATFGIHTPRLFEELQRPERADIAARRAAVAEFNRTHTHKKRGLSALPTIFGIAFGPAFMNQAGCTLTAYTDGSVRINHGGVEIGQGIHTKICQVVASGLGIPMQMVFVSNSDTAQVPNASATAASSTFDLNGMAALRACNQLLERLLPFLPERWLRGEADGGPPEVYRAPHFANAVLRAYMSSVDLTAHGFYNVAAETDLEQPGPYAHAVNYWTTGVACSEVELDTLTGDMRVLRTDVLMDLGVSPNPAIDVGQVEGAVVQGMGYMTLEETVWGSTDEHRWLKPGQCLTRGPGAYKIPSFNDVPVDLRVTLLADAPNPRAVHSSKAVGEPPLFLGATAFFAARAAALAAYGEAEGATAERVAARLANAESPASAERLRLLCGGPLADTFVDKLVAQGGRARPAIFA